MSTGFMLSKRSLYVVMVIFTCALYIAASWFDGILLLTEANSICRQALRKLLPLPIAGVIIGFVLIPLPSYLVSVAVGVCSRGLGVDWVAAMIVSGVSSAIMLFYLDWSIVTSARTSQLQISMVIARGYPKTGFSSKSTQPR